eukprot:GHVT01075040.1.p1 GENE.GHVT01075040.1~~GHVT01075040.1.p1  ORF type:complete len:386 (-),score=87.75 GHVT01075040.1:208-1365(-)
MRRSGGGDANAGGSGGSESNRVVLMELHPDGVMLKCMAQGREVVSTVILSLDFFHVYTFVPPATPHLEQSTRVSSSPSSAANPSSGSSQDLQFTFLVPIGRLINSLTMLDEQSRLRVSFDLLSCSLKLEMLEQPAYAATARHTGRAPPPQTLGPCMAGVVESRFILRTMNVTEHDSMPEIWDALRGDASPAGSFDSFRLNIGFFTDLLADMTTAEDLNGKLFLSLFPVTRPRSEARKDKPVMTVEWGEECHKYWEVPDERGIFITYDVARKHRRAYKLRNFLSVQPALKVAHSLRVAMYDDGLLNMQFQLKYLNQSPVLLSFFVFPAVVLEDGGGEECAAGREGSDDGNEAEEGAEVQAEDEAEDVMGGDSDCGASEDLSVEEEE